MATFKEKLQAIKERTRPTREAIGRQEEKIRVALKSGVGMGKVITTRGTAIAEQQKQNITASGKAIQSARRDIGKATGALFQVTTGKNPNIKAKRLTKAEKIAEKQEKQALRKDGTPRRSPREQSKLVKASRSKAIGGALSYQNVKPDRSPEQKGITEQPTMMSALLPLEIIGSHRTMFLEEPERAKTHRSYGNMDMIGNKSKKGATDYRYDLEAMFR